MSVEAVVTAKDYHGNIVIEFWPEVNDKKIAELEEKMRETHSRWVILRREQTESGHEGCQRLYVTLFSCARCHDARGEVSCFERGTCGKPDARQFLDQLQQLMTEMAFSYEWHAPYEAA